MQRGLLVAVLLFGGGLLASDRDFMLSLKLVNSHLGQVFLGCREGATDAFDRDFDDLAPPPGIQTGYVGFISTLPNSLLYKDIKAHGDLKDWRINVQVYEGKPLKMSWLADQLPRFYTLTLVTDDSELDMRKVTQVEFTKNQLVAVVAALDLAAVAAAEAEAVPAAAVAVSAPAPAPASPEPPSAPSAPTPQPAPPISSQRVASGIHILVLAMGGLLLLVVIFAAVRRQ